MNWKTGQAGVEGPQGRGTYRQSMFSCGMRTWSNWIHPLSIPFRPILAPRSPMCTPGEVMMMNNPQYHRPHVITSTS
jgi:hypothetical protein